METINALMSRRSIRKYTNQLIENEKIEILLKAAMQAPSARNTQSWQFIVVSDKETLKAIMKVHPYSSMLAEASHAILVCGDKSLEPSEAYCSQNCSAATQNILIAAHALGLGAVWLGVYPREERIKGITELFKLPEHIFPVTLISLGYPDEKKEAAHRYSFEKIHFEKWG